MDLSTSYLGFNLPHPFISGASPLAYDLDTVKRLEDAGAAAITMNSLFEEQIVSDQTGSVDVLDSHAESFAEALFYLPSSDAFRLGPDDYLDHLRKIKESVSIPVIASLNGVTPGGWTDYARLIEEAGADALELNVYTPPTSVEQPGESVERESLELVKTVKSSVKIPVAVKLSAFYTSLPHFARALDDIGVDGIVIFNRFYQPDIDVEELEVTRTLRLSTSQELLPRLRWLAMLSGRLCASLAVTGGVHEPIDAVKSVMTGAHAVQLVSCLLEKGPEYLTTLRNEMAQWMEEHEYESLGQMRGSMSLLNCPNPGAFERANYAQILQSWQPSV
jgi:dihydroorotate dehydrogenase (fumarate)